MTPTLTKALPWALLVAAVAAWGYEQQKAGQLEATLALAALQHRADSLASVKTAELATIARRSVDSARAEAAVEVKRDKAIRAKSDSQIVRSANERLTAGAVLADSLATIGQLRTEIGRLVSVSRADSITTERERRQSATTITSLLRTDSLSQTAIQRGVEAIHAATQRAERAEAQVKLYQQAKPSAVGNTLRTIAWVAVGVGIGRLVRVP